MPAMHRTRGAGIRTRPPTPGPAGGRCPRVGRGTDGRDHCYPGRAAAPAGAATSATVTPPIATAGRRSTRPSRRTRPPQCRGRSVCWPWRALSRSRRSPPVRPRGRRRPPRPALWAVSPIRAVRSDQIPYSRDREVLLADVHPGDPGPGLAGGQEDVDPVVDEQRDALGQHGGDLSSTVSRNSPASASFSRTCTAVTPPATAAATRSARSCPTAAACDLSVTR